MRAFLDFEASSLGKRSYPIEVAWVFEDGSGETHLIRPAPGWTDWDAGAEAIHHIPREELERNGEPHERVAARMVEALTGHALFASAPSWDGKWLSVLLRAAGLPRHSLRLRATGEAEAEIAAEMLRERLDGPALRAAVDAVREEAFAALAGHAPRHRAFPDAEEERRRWIAVREGARRLAKDQGVETPSTSTRSSAISRPITRTRFST